MRPLSYVSAACPVFKKKKSTVDKRDFLIYWGNGILKEKNQVFVIIWKMKECARKLQE